MFSFIVALWYDLLFLTLTPRAFYVWPWPFTYMFKMLKDIAWVKKEMGEL